jgi:hypothetical protein
LIRHAADPVPQLAGRLAEADEVHLHPALLELAQVDEGHAMVRFACALAPHAFEVATGRWSGREAVLRSRAAS